MKIDRKDKLFKIIVFLLGAVMLFFTGFAQIDSGFQNDSENLVIGSMVYGARESGLSDFGLTTATEKTADGYILGVMREYYDLQDVEYDPYLSQIGLQGYVCQLAARLLCTGRGVSAIISLRTLLCAVCCALMALVAMGITFAAGKKNNNRLAVAFFLTFLLSPWVRDFSGNLYWVEFTWFVPMLLGVVMSLDYKRFDKPWFYALVVLALAVKSACGYEYITTIMLGLILFPLVDLLLCSGDERKRVFFVIFKLGLAALAGFFAAIAVHALMRGGGDILRGIDDIYQNDLLRCAIGGDAARYPGESGTNLYYRLAIDASIAETLSAYFKFPGQVVAGVEAALFVPLALVALGVFAFSARKREKRWELLLYVLSFVTTISWYVLGKQHSYLHTHINFGLWYFGFVQMQIYALISLTLKAAAPPSGGE